MQDRWFLQRRELITSGGRSMLYMHEDGTLRLAGSTRLCVPRHWPLVREILEEAHRTPYMIHAGETKMYRGLRPTFYWKNMRRSIARFVRECTTCYLMKDDRQRPAGLL